MKKTKDPTYELIESLVERATKCKAGTALLSIKKAKNYEGGDLYILFCAKGIDKFDAVECLVKSLSEEEK